MIEKTLVLIKPDGVQRALIGEIISRIERTGLKIIAMKMVHATKSQAGTHYADDEEWLVSVGEKALKAYEKRGEKPARTPREQGMWIREMLMNYITMAPAVAIVIEGHGATAKVRALVGGTSPQEAPPGTIRGDYSIDSYMLGDHLERPVQNLIHASESPQEAEREIAVWFREDELHVFKRVDEDLAYRRGAL